MRILAIETTDKMGTIAAADGPNLLAEIELDRSQRSAQSLVPGLHRLLESVGWQPGDVQLVAVTVGPGSFTGLRVGITTAKVLAYAVGAEILGIDTLETIAAAVPDEVDVVCTVLDAQRGEVSVRRFVRGKNGLFEPIGPAKLLEIDAWLSSLAQGDVVSGPILAKLVDRLPAGVVAVEPSRWPPRAATVARLAARYSGLGRHDDLWALVPRYARRAAAEEKWEARHSRQDGT